MLSLALLIGVALASGCMASRNSNSGGRVTPEVASEVTGWLFPATIAQANVGSAFGQILTRLRDRQFRLCLAGFGFGPMAQRFALSGTPLLSGGLPAAPGFTRPGVLWAGLADLQAIRSTGMLVPINIGNKLAGAGSGLSPAEEAAAMTKSLPCWNRVNRLDTPLQGGAVAGLRLLWFHAVLRLQESAAVQSADQSFSSCVVQHGAPQRASQSLQVFAQWLEIAVNGPTYTSTAPLTPSTQSRQLDAHWSAVFAQCAVPVVSVMHRLLPPLQKTFLQAHYQQIVVVDNLVASTVTRLASAP